MPARLSTFHEAMTLRTPRHVFHVATAWHGTTGGIGIVAYEKTRRGQRGAHVDTWGLTIPECVGTALLARAVEEALARAVANGFDAVEIVSDDRMIRKLRTVYAPRTPVWTWLSGCGIQTLHLRQKPRAKLLQARLHAREAAGLPPKRPRRKDPEPMKLWEIGLEMELAQLEEEALDLAFE